MDTNRYQNGKIYKITDVGYNNCYIGSTTESLSQRMARHRKAYQSYTEGRSNLTVFQIFHEYGRENCKIEWIENYPCNCKKELEAREGYHIRNTNCVNKVIAVEASVSIMKTTENTFKSKSANTKNNTKIIISNKLKNTMKTTETNI